MNNKICCFTGHRPKGLGMSLNKEDYRFINLNTKIKKQIEIAILDGYNHFISGMAIGSDMICAKLVLELKNKYKDIILECAIPCLNQNSKWNQQYCLEYEKILDDADIITQVSDCEYYDGCMKKRNEYMVDKASLVIAVYNGKLGGAKQTVNLANKKGKKVVIINPREC